MKIESKSYIIEIDDSERTRCEIWSRVMGYARPVSEWNPGKRQEFKDRLPFRCPPDILD